MAINKTINKRTNTHGAMRNCIEYVLRQDKTNELFTCVTGPYCHDEINYDLVYRTFLEEKKVWDKDSGRMYAHNIISWHKDEQITPEQALEFGKEFAENWFSGFQTLVAVHKDKDHIHCHLVTNSVSYEDGRKLHNTKKDLERMKQLTNQMCRERGLTVAEKGKHFDGSQIEKGEVIAWSKDKYNLFRQQVKESFVADCAMAVLKALENCISKEKFIEKMKQFGWNVNWTEKRKHITFQNQDGKKVRDSNLSKTFHLDISKEGLENEFNGNYERVRAEAERTNGADEELAGYYRQVEAACEGAGGVTGASDGRERRVTGEKSEDERVYPEISGKDTQAENGKQKLFFENHEMQEEMRKSNVKIQQMTAELSEMRKLNQSLQQSNDDLRNRNGLMSRSEQELLEEEIKDVRDRNSKLQIQVNQSSVEAVEQAQQKQEEAEKKVRTIQCQYNKLQENAETVKEKADQKIKSLKKEMKEKTSFWRMLYMVFVVFEIIKSTVVQNDLFACIKVLIRVWCRYVEWVIRPSELNIWGEKEYFSTEWSWCLRVMAIIIVVGVVIAGEMFVLKKIEQYRRVWDKYSMRLMVVSLEMIIVSGDVMRRFMPINLVVLFGIINIAVMEIRIYYRRANEIY